MNVFSIYVSLHTSKDGLLSYKEEYVGKRVRKYYYLTPEGKAEKVRYLNELKDFLATLNQLVFPELNTA